MKHIRRMMAGLLFVVAIAAIFIVCVYYSPYSLIVIGFALILFSVYNIGHGLRMMKGLDE